MGPMSAVGGEDLGTEPRTVQILRSPAQVLVKVLHSLPQRAHDMVQAQEGAKLSAKHLPEIEQ